MSLRKNITNNTGTFVDDYLDPDTLSDLINSNEKEFEECFTRLKEKEITKVKISIDKWNKVIEKDDSEGDYVLVELEESVISMSDVRKDLI